MLIYMIACIVAFKNVFHLFLSYIFMNIDACTQFYTSQKYVFSLLVMCVLRVHFLNYMKFYFFALIMEVSS